MPSYNGVASGDTSVGFILKLNRRRQSQFGDTKFTLASLIDAFQGSLCQHDDCPWEAAEDKTRVMQPGMGDGVWVLDRRVDLVDLMRLLLDPFGSRESAVTVTALVEAKFDGGPAVTPEPPHSSSNRQARGSETTPYLNTLMQPQTIPSAQ